MVAALGMLAVFASIGLGRFALGMLLPSMGRSLGLDYAQMGYIGTANFVGYLGAVLAAGRLARLASFRTLVSASVLLIAVSLALVSRAQGFAGVLTLYLVTGFGSGGANVLAMALVSHWFGPRSRGKGAGVVVSGSSLGIMASGALVPALNATFGAEGWRASWLAMAAVALAVAALCAFALRDWPAQMGLEPAGAEPATGAARTGPRQRSPRALWRLGGVYLLFGFTYAIYATFLVTSLVAERGFDEAAAGRFWSAVGVLSLLSGPVFGALSDRFGRGPGLAGAFGLHACAYLLVAAVPGEAAAYASVACFGVAAWSVPTIMAAAVGDHVEPERAAAAFGAITVAFGIGQIAGPAMAGALADATGGFAPSFAMAAALAALAAGLGARIGR